MRAARYGLQFHHLGLAVREEAAATRFLTGLGYKVGDLIADPRQNVRVAMCHGENLPAIELVLPLEGLGPLASVLKRQDGAFYHSCYTTNDAEGALRIMAEDGLELTPISSAKPAVLFDGTPVSFHYIAGFGLIELIHAGAISNG